MEIIEIKKKAIVLDRVESEKLAKILRYAKHRMGKHQDSAGVKYLCSVEANSAFIEYILINLANDF